MSPELQKKTMFKLHLFIGVIVLLFGLVALLVKVVDKPDEEVVEIKTITESEFNGIDGSLTVFAFDWVASVYIERLDESDDLSELIEFDAWLIEQDDVLPQTDAFKQRIRLRNSNDMSFVLMSAGADHELETEDDYIKTYTYEPTAGDI